MTDPPRGPDAPRRPHPPLLVDGRIVPARDVHVPWNLPGLRQGFGLFETIRVGAGRAFLPGQHAQRLTEAAPLLGIDPWMHHRTLARAIDSLVDAAGIAEGALRVFLLPRSSPAGEEGSDDHLTGLFGVGPSREPSRSRYLGTITPLSGRPPASAKAVLSPDLRDPRFPLVGLKTISYAGERLLLARAREQGADEALRRNLQGRIAEGTRSNIFLIEGASLLTPPLTEGLLPGITRWFVLRMAPEAGFAPLESPVPVERLVAADEAFLASTIRGIVPLVALDGRPIGSGSPGPGSVRLRAILERHITRRSS